MSRGGKLVCAVTNNEQENCPEEEETCPASVSFGLKRPLESWRYCTKGNISNILDVLDLFQGPVDAYLFICQQ